MDILLHVSPLAEATVELSLDSPRNERKKEATAKPSAPAPTSLPAAASLAKPQPPALEEVSSDLNPDKDFQVWAHEIVSKYLINIHTSLFYPLFIQLNVSLRFIYWNKTANGKSEDIQRCTLIYRKQETVVYSASEASNKI